MNLTVVPGILSATLICTVPAFKTVESEYVLFPARFKVPAPFFINLRPAITPEIPSFAPLLVVTVANPSLTAISFGVPAVPTTPEPVLVPARCHSPRGKRCGPGGLVFVRA